jgi:DNA-binding transcriptional regulator/RsmH inhibitor MraZ
MLYRLEVWQTFSRLLLNIPDAVTAISALKRVVIGNARCETIDEQHRLALAPDLSKFAGLGKTAYWVPIGNYVELWSPDSFDENVRGSFLRLLRQMAREEE